MRYVVLEPVDDCHHLHVLSAGVVLMIVLILNCICVQPPSNSHAVTQSLHWSTMFGAHLTHCHLFHHMICYTSSVSHDQAANTFLPFTTHVFVVCYSRFGGGHNQEDGVLKPQGLLFGVSDALLDTPAHASYMTGAYAHLLFFDIPGLLTVSVSYLYTTSGYMRWYHMRWEICISYHLCRINGQQVYFSLTLTRPSSARLLILCKCLYHCYCDTLLCAYACSLVYVLVLMTRAGE